jgi:(1->4)-alpha-D-glucan 1-alpha-D-glucosylmutase
VAEFHAANAERLACWPAEMLATTTHDTKRSEDARARINVLSEGPAAWQAAVARWRRLNAANRTRIAGSQAPDANDEYLFYQTLIGAWPAERHGSPLPDRAPADLVARLRAYMDKAIKEAKVRTSWITPNAAYESATAQFIERTLAGRTAAAFLAAFLPFARRVFAAGMVNSLAQLALKIASPGVPDFYQGTELWDLSLVDPDNRRPVDFAHRRRLLHDLEPLLAQVGPDAPAPAGAAHTAIAALLDEWPDGRIKLFLTALGMRLRRAHPELFLSGTYHPMTADGPRAAHLVAFARQHGAHILMVIAPRLTTQITLDGRLLPLGHASWGDSALHLPEPWAHRTFRDLVTGTRFAPSGAAAGPRALRLDGVLATCPVALLWAAPSCY